MIREWRTDAVWLRLMNVAPLQFHPCCWSEIGSYLIILGMHTLLVIITLHAPVKCNTLILKLKPKRESSGVLLLEPLLDFEGEGNIWKGNVVSRENLVLHCRHAIKSSPLNRTLCALYLFARCYSPPTATSVEYQKAQVFALPSSCRDVTQVIALNFKIFVRFVAWLLHYYNWLDIARIVKKGINISGKAFNKERKFKVD